ncbi:MAG: Asp-tRNA(Asn)/Glu-tRNA(Gln) amidotransferase subunit GatC [bacterium]|nr:Asp-tRNA(Asn)/Glu-tRNA(Gln) amidotransferase subunit GatC [bacterium]
MLTKKDLAHLAELARIELKEGEEQKLQKDLGAILDYFQELKSVDTENVAPMTGGTELKSVVREDVISPKSKVKSQNGVEAFPETKNGYLKVPPVF